MRNVCLIVHGKELEERHFRNLGLMFDKMVYENWQSQHFMELSEESQM